MTNIRYAKGCVLNDSLKFNFKKRRMKPKSQFYETIKKVSLTVTNV